MGTAKHEQQNGVQQVAAALEAARGQVGQKEIPKGSNSGPMVDKYLNAAGLRPGFAWCQAFVYWCYAHAAEQLNVPNPVVKTAGVADCWNRTAAARKLSAAAAVEDPQLVQAGDQFILLFGKGEGHTGIVERVEGGLIYTIEGNSNADGSREGYEVVRHERALTDKALQGFIRYA